MTIGKWTIERRLYEIGSGYYIEWNGWPMKISAHPVPKYWWAHPYALLASICAIIKTRTVVIKVELEKAGF